MQVVCVLVFENHSSPIAFFNFSSFSAEREKEREREEGREREREN